MASTLFIPDQHLIPSSAITVRSDCDSYIPTEAWLQREPRWKNLKSQATTGNGTGPMHALTASQLSCRHLQCRTLNRCVMPVNQIRQPRSLTARDCRLHRSEPIHGQASPRARDPIE